VFLAKAIEGMTQVFGSTLPQSNQSIENTMKIWISIARNGVTERATS
jgi:hypothetical protein